MRLGWLGFSSAVWCWLRSSFRCDQGTIEGIRASSSEAKSRIVSLDMRRTKLEAINRTAKLKPYAAGSEWHPLHGLIVQLAGLSG